MRLPDFVLVGAPRSGTTTLASHLQEHPGVFIPRKELHFFDLNWARGVEWYSHQFSSARAGQITGEGTPMYMSDYRAMHRLCRTAPSATLIAILRDPADRAHSHFNFRVARNLDGGTFEEALDREAGDEPGAFPYLHIGKYASHLEHLENQEHASVQVLWTDDLEADQGGVLDRLAAILGVDPFSPEGRSRKRNAAVRYRSQTVRRVSIKAKHRLPPLARALRRINRVELDPPPLRPEARARIVAAMEWEYQRLEQWTGRSLERWRNKV